MKLKHVSVLFILLAEISFFAYGLLPINDYCDPKWCPTLQKHTACRNSGRFSSKCPPDLKLLKLSRDDKQYVLDLHNQYRMFVALGLQPLFPGSSETFPVASGMMKLKWDEEQAFMASLQLRTCESHDFCHNTAFNSSSGRLILSGQNIFYFAKYGNRFTLSQYLELATYYWFNEYQVTPLEMISSLSFFDGFVIGHFTQMIHDKNYAVGCSACEWTDDNGEQKHTKITCNYVKANYGNRPVYETGNGSICENCKVCDEEEFYGLCIE